PHVPARLCPGRLAPRQLPPRPAPAHLADWLSARARPTCPPRTHTRPPLGSTSGTPASGPQLVRHRLDGSRTSEIFLGALVGGAVGFFTGGVGLLGDALLGAGIGMLSAAARGDKVWTGAAIGFGFGAVAGMGDWIPAVGGEGIWVDI